MAKKILLFFVLLFAASFIYAVPYDMILIGDPILDDLRFLSLESKNIFLSFTPPLAPHEVLDFLEKIDASALSQAAKEAYDRVLNRLNNLSFLSLSFQNFAASMEIAAALEGRLRLNSAASWHSYYPDIPSLLSIPVKVFFSDILQLYFDFTYGMAQGNNSNLFNLNLPFISIFGTHNEDMPLRAFLAAGGDWWNFQIGRDRLFWGTGHTASLSFNDNSDYNDFARLSFFSEHFKYSFIINQMPIYLTESLFLNDGIYRYSDLYDELISEGYNFTTTTNRYFYLHRLDVSLFNRVSLGLMEGVMTGNSPIELRFLSPLMIFHNYFSWLEYDYWPGEYYDFNNDDMGSMIGSFFSLELNARIIDSLFFYGQFVLNEYSIPGERNSGNPLPPNGLGYMAGLHYSLSMKSWGCVFFTEFIYTDPYLYMLSSPYASFIQMRRADKNFTFTGYPRDTMALTTGAEFFKGDTLRLNAVFSWISKGEFDNGGIKWNYEIGGNAPSKKTPTGIPENNFILSLDAHWQILSFLGIKGNITGIVSLNSGHQIGVTRAGGLFSLAVYLKF